jgi:CheY-like chemotaxis protein
MLSTCGYTIHTAQDPKEALAQLLGGTLVADLIIIDYMMPYINGVEFTKSVRAWERQTGTRIPILLCSGISDKDFTAM